MILIAVACGNQAGARTPAVGDPFPDYAAPTLHGDTVTIRDLRGKVVLLNVWATWCPPCRREMPGLQALHEDLAEDGLRLVGVSVDGPGTQPELRAFLEEHGITYTILHDPDERIVTLMSILGLPQTYLIGREGRILHQWLGEIDPMGGDVRGRVVEALGEGA